MDREREEGGEEKKGRREGRLRERERLKRLREIAFRSGSSRWKQQPSSRRTLVLPLLSARRRGAERTEKAVRVRDLCFSASEVLEHICFGY